MNIDHLRYFLVLTQEMHYSRAAQRRSRACLLGMSAVRGAIPRERVMGDSRID